jgi:hypothetical protein
MDLGLPPLAEVEAEAEAEVESSMTSLQRGRICSDL